MSLGVHIETMSDRMTVLQPVDADKARTISPWPDRISGDSPWTPRNRQARSIADEYDRYTYRQLMDLWKTFYHNNENQKNHSLALAFYDEVRRINNQKMAENTAVYGSIDLRQSLVSLSDHLYSADINMFEMWWRTWIVETIWRAKQTVDFDEILEIGCGSGVNLVHAYVRLGLSFVTGLDISPSAVNFLNCMTTDVSIPSHFESLDARKANGLEHVVSCNRSWSLLSVHAIEQLHGLSVDWFQDLLALSNPPKLGLHFEPIQWGDKTRFAEECAEYARLNDYNSDFFQILLTAEEQGLITILTAEKRVLGHSAYNPTSVIIWKPSNRR